jgi:hypothetical protein
MYEHFINFKPTLDCIKHSQVSSEKNLNRLANLNESLLPIKEQVAHVKGVIHNINDDIPLTVQKNSVDIVISNTVEIMNKMEL